MDAVGNIFSFSWETQLIEWLQANIGGAAASVISALSIFGEELMIIAVVGFLYWSYDKQFGKFLTLNALTVGVFSPMLKNTFLRLRPYFESDGIRLLKIVDRSADVYDVAAQGYSFPSFHSANSVSVFGSIAVYARKRWLTWLAVLIPFLVGFSRVFVGAHYPTDVLAGWALGLAAVALVSWLQRVVGKQWILCVILVAAALPGFFFCRSADFFTAYGMLLGFTAGMPFEERFVRFENTREPVRTILRVIGGGAVYLGLNALLKAPFSAGFLGGGTMAAYLVRTLRYAIVFFVCFAVYPMVFRVTGRIGRSRAEITEKTENI